MKHARVWLLTVLLVLSPIIIYAEDQNIVLVQELFIKSGLEKQLSQFSLHLDAESDLISQEAYSNKIFADLRYVIKSSGKKAFALEKLKEPVILELREKLTDQDIKEIFTWLDSSIGKKITQLEEAASTPVAKAEKLKYASNLKSSPEMTGRLMVIQRLESAGQIIERAVEMNKITLTAISMAMTATLPKEQQKSYDEILYELDQLGFDIEASEKERVFASLLYTYRSLTDAEIEKYIEFLTTTVGSKYNSATFDAIKKASFFCMIEWGTAVGNAIQKMKIENNK